MRNETKLLEVRIIRLAIYLLPFQTFACKQAGFGVIEPATIPIVILVILSFIKSGFQPLKAFSKKQSVYSIAIFLGLMIITTIFNFLIDNFYDYYKNLGVLFSLVFL